MNSLLWVTLVFVIAILYKRLRPVRGLQYINASALCKKMTRLDTSLKILDVRDATEYEPGSIPGSINISLGRLSYVQKKELHPDDNIIIVSSSHYKGKVAARKLQKEGFHHISYLLGGFSSWTHFIHQQQGQMKMMNTPC